LFLTPGIFTTGDIKIIIIVIIIIIPKFSNSNNVIYTNIIIKTVSICI